MLEFEKKYMLTEEAYHCLYASMGKELHSYFQTNYYFDTDDFFMNQKGITCRIRYKDGCYKATIKNHATGKNGCSTEEDLAVTATFDPTAFAPLHLHLQGQMLTERTVLFENDICKAVLDRNTYLETTDYELELEYLDGHEEDAKQALNCIIKNKKEWLRLHNKSKSGRFFERKRKQSISKK